TPCFVCLHNHPTPAIYTLSLHDALPICLPAADRACELHSGRPSVAPGIPGSPFPGLLDPELVPDRLRSCHAGRRGRSGGGVQDRSEEHTSELQSRFDLVCRLLLEKKKNK